jgi:transcriptional regulator with XRE-family HTH domain
VSRRDVHPLVQQVAAARKAQGLTVKAVADRAGYPADTFSAYENGRYQPSLFRFVDWANTLGLDVVLVPRKQG